MTANLKEEGPFNGKALPVFSTDTQWQAEYLIVLIGTVQYGEHPSIPGKAWYRWPHLNEDVDNFSKLNQVLSEQWERMKTRRLA